MDVTWSQDAVCGIEWLVKMPAPGHVSPDVERSTPACLVANVCDSPLQPDLTYHNNVPTLLSGSLTITSHLQTQYAEKLRLTAIVQNATGTTLMTPRHRYVDRGHEPTDC